MLVSWGLKSGVFKFKGGLYSGFYVILDLKSTSRLWVQLATNHSLFTNPHLIQIKHSDMYKPVEGLISKGFY